MHSVAIDQLNDEIAELETWLTEHLSHHVDDKVMVRMELIRKQILREELISKLKQ